MKKNKKLKSQFKKLLNQQIHNAIKENPDFYEEKQEKSQDTEKINIDSNDNIQQFSAKKDILKTIIISSVIIGSIVALSFVLQKYGLFEKATSLILKTIGAK